MRYCLLLNTYFKYYLSMRVSAFISLDVTQQKGQQITNTKFILHYHFKMEEFEQVICHKSIMKIQRQQKITFVLFIMNYLKQEKIPPWFCVVFCKLNPHFRKKQFSIFKRKTFYIFIWHKLRPLQHLFGKKIILSYSIQF